MNEATAGRQRYVLGHTETRSLLGRREPGEVAVLLGGIGLGVLASLLSGGSVAGFVVLAGSLLAALAVVFLPFRGRSLYRWLPVDLAYLRAGITGQNRYRSTAKEAGVLLDGRPVPVPPPGPVGRIVWLRHDFRDGELAVLAQPDGALTTCLEVEGPGVGLFDNAEQEAAVQRWGTLLRDLANGENLVSRLSVVERCVPRDPGAHQRYVDEHGWVPPQEHLVVSYDELHDLVGAVSEQHRTYVVLHLPNGRALSRAARAAGGGDVGLSAVASREAAALAMRLEEAGLRVVRALDEPHLAALIASFYMPWRSADDAEGVSSRHAWPGSAKAGAGHYEADGWCHATAWIKTWPLVAVGVDFLAPLLVQTPGVVRTVAVTFDLVPTDLAMTAVMADLTSDNANASASAKSGRTADPRDHRQLSQAQQRADDVSQGAAGVRLVGYVTVSAPSADQLEEAKRRIAAASARSWLSLEWCDREHDTAFVNTLPFARGIR